VDTFVEVAGKGVMKVLLVDRGFINGPQIGRLKRDYGIDTVIPIRSDMDLIEDVQGLRQLATSWESYEPKHRPPLASSRASHASHPTAQKRERARQETLARRQAQQQAQDSPDPSKVLKE
jgi:hypothetical protein